MSTLVPSKGFRQVGNLLRLAFRKTSLRARRRMRVRGAVLEEEKATRRLLSDTKEGTKENH